MDISEIQQKKKELSRNIMDLVNEFRKDTEMNITELKADIQNYKTDNSKEHYSITGIIIKLDI